MNRNGVSLSDSSGFPIGQSRSNPVVRLPSIVTGLAFHASLWKFSGVDLWPHVYIGDVSSSGAIGDYLTYVWISICAFMILYMRRCFLPFLHDCSFICLFIGFCVVHSLFISESLLRSMQLSIYYFVIAFAVYCYVRSRSVEAVYLGFSWFGVLFVGVSLLAFFYPEYSRMIGTHSGLFRGFVAHKNDLGFVLVPIISVLLLRFKLVGALFAMPAILIALYMQFEAFSAQSIIMVAFVIIFHFYRRTLPAQSFFPITLILFIFVPFLMVLGYGYASDALGIFGKDASFSDRDVIWAFFIDLIWQGNYLGFGLGVFFSDPSLLSVLRRAGLSWHFSTTHSAYLESAVALGLLGFGIFATMVLYHVSKAFILYLRSPSLYDVSFSIILVCVVGGVTATEKLFTTGFGWLLFCFAVVLYGRINLAMRKRGDNSTG